MAASTTGIVVVGEGDLGPILLEQILIDMEAGAKRLQSSFQPLDGILLLRMVETFVVHAGDAQHHAHIAAFVRNTLSFQKPYRLM
jgi:hypothetical protein